MISKSQRILKRSFDIFASFFTLWLLFVPMLLLIVIATVETKKNGLFCQTRIGKNAKPFLMFKIRTLKGKDHTIKELNTQQTVVGKWLRKTKLDELPQLINVLNGTMSLVGPRPDVAGYADNLQGKDRIILSVRPGITGPATIKFKNEEILLLSQNNPQEYNDQVIWPEKVKINIQYLNNWSFSKDLGYIFKSIF